MLTLLASLIISASSYPGVGYDAAPYPTYLGSDFQLNGYDLICSGMTTDTAADGTILRACSAYSGAATNTTGGNLDLAAGVATKGFTLATFSNCTTDTMTVTVDGTAHALVEATDWNKGASNAAACTSLASAIDALSGVGATCQSTTVVITRDSGTNRITVASSDATCATANDNTDGSIRIWHDLKMPVNGIKLCFDSDGNSCMRASANDTIKIAVGGTDVWTLTGSSLTLATGFLVVLNGQMYASSGATKLGLSNSYPTTTGMATGGVLFTGEVQLPRQVATTVSQPVACGSTTVGVIEYVDDSDDTAAAKICVCAATNDSTFSWRRLDDLATACGFY